MLKITRQQILCLMYTCLFLLEAVLAYTDVKNQIPGTMLTGLRVLLYGIFLMLAVCAFLFQSYHGGRPHLMRYSRRELLIVLVVAVVFAFSVLSSKNYIMFLQVLFILCAKNLNFERLVKYALKLHIVTGLIIIGLALAGVLLIRESVRGDGTLRYALGFTHANRLGAYVFQIICEIIYLCRKNLKYKILLGCLLLSGVFYLLTNSNMSFLASILLVIATFLYRAFLDWDGNEQRKRQLFQIVLCILFILIGIFVVDFVRSPDKYMDLSSAFLTLKIRVQYCIVYLKYYGVNLLGHEVLNVSIGTSARYYTLDCSYVLMVLREGLLATVVMLIGFAALVRMHLKKGNYILLIITVILLIYMIVETAPLSYGFNLFFTELCGVIFLESAASASSSALSERSKGKGE